MDKMEDWKLFDYLAGKASPEEFGEVEEWLAEDPSNIDHIDQLRELWKYTDSFNELETVDMQKDWHNVRDRMGFDQENKSDGHVDQIRNFKFYNFRKYPLLKIAALIIIIMIPAILLEMKYHFMNPVDTQWVVTRSGNQIQDITLADGSLVTLNADSEISYPEEFEKGRREVRLKGEAWFEIVASAEQPFFISTGDNLVIQVIGTSFNVRSRENSKEVVVKVISGIVTMYKADNKKDILILSEGEQGISDDAGLTKGPISDLNPLSWKTGMLVFKDTPLRDVIISLMNYSDRTIVIKDKGLENEGLTSTYENDMDLMDILEDIAMVLDINYSIVEDTILFHMAGN